MKLRHRRERMHIPVRCPMCGSTRWHCVDSRRSRYSWQKGLLGTVFLGEQLGKWAGFLGERQMVYACPCCRFTMAYRK